MPGVRSTSPRGPVGQNEFQGKGYGFTPASSPTFSQCSLLPAGLAGRAGFEGPLLAGSQWGPPAQLLPPHPSQLLPGGRHLVRADGSLHLDGALQDDAGRYSCVVTNTAGSQRRDVDLVVQGESRGSKVPGVGLGGWMGLGETHGGDLDLEYLCFKKW